MIDYDSIVDFVNGVYGSNENLAAHTLLSFGINPRTRQPQRPQVMSEQMLWLKNVLLVASVLVGRPASNANRKVALMKLLEIAIKALEAIRMQGKVCEIYEICEHVSCSSSYASWAIADEALRHLAPDVEAINAEIERFLKINPAAEKDRQAMFDDLLAAYEERGVIAKLTFNANFDDGLDDSIIGSLP